MSTNFQVFALQPYGGRNPIAYTVITPEPASVEVVTAAWAYAVRYTAKGLDLPDHDAAIQLLLKRHPSWRVVNSTVSPITVNLNLAEQDIPENQS